MAAAPAQLFQQDEIVTATTIPKEPPPGGAIPLDSVAIRFCGDSGDGMQLTGGEFTNTTAVVGNDFATFPDFPAEIRAPRGTTFGVSGFQIHFASHSIYTPGDAINALVSMNPAAFKMNIGDVEPGADRLEGGVRGCLGHGGSSLGVTCNSSRP